MVMLYTEVEFTHRPDTKNMEYWGTNAASDPWGETRYFGMLTDMKFLLLKEDQLHLFFSFNSSIFGLAYHEAN